VLSANTISVTVTSFISILFSYAFSLKSKVKQSLYMPGRGVGGEDV
jgi:hypothetical protein